MHNGSYEKQVMTQPQAGEIVETNPLLLKLEIFQLLKILAPAREYAIPNEKLVSLLTWVLPEAYGGKDPEQVRKMLSRLESVTGKSGPFHMAQSHSGFQKEDTKEKLLFEYVQTILHGVPRSERVTSEGGKRGRCVWWFETQDMPVTKLMQLIGDSDCDECTKRVLLSAVWSIQPAMDRKTAKAILENPRTASDILFLHQNAIAASVRSRDLTKTKTPCRQEELSVKRPLQNDTMQFVSTNAAQQFFVVWDHLTKAS